MLPPANMAESDCEPLAAATPLDCYRQYREKKDITKYVKFK
jgi:hypothetical protein